MSSLLLNGGNLNTKIIQKELVTALAEDRNYKITDDAKKKHISTASSYDEFRNFVACADQKRVSNTEMESLSKPEKGWKSKTNLALGQTGKLPKNRNKSSLSLKNKKNNSSTISKKFPENPPKNPMEFDREWRRHCKTPEMKLKLLLLCGPMNFGSIFKSEIDVGLLGQIIQCFSDILKKKELEEKQDDVSNQIVLQKNVKEKISENVQDENNFVFPENLHDCILELFSVIPRTGRFKLNVQFLQAQDKNNIKTVLDHIEKNRRQTPQLIIDAHGGAEEDDEGVLRDEVFEKLRMQFKL